MTNPRAIAEPSACTHCGIPHREHYQQWTQAAGWHQWQQPTNAQILARMRARRAGRQTSENTMTDLEPATTYRESLEYLLRTVLAPGDAEDAIADLDALERAARAEERHAAAARAAALQTANDGTLIAASRQQILDVITATEA